jgi:ABC-type transport system involved in cytochrome bd biosynthesis fused ATPase/permease subunit
VIGKVGNGKSSLLQAILNEMHVVEGTVATTGRNAIVQQDPFILRGSVRENILFGKALDEDLLRKVIEVCQLKTDLDQLEEGLNTLIGEKGFTLSGG